MSYLNTSQLLETDSHSIYTYVALDTFGASLICLISVGPGDWVVGSLHPEELGRLVPCPSCLRSSPRKLDTHSLRLARLPNGDEVS